MTELVAVRRIFSALKDVEGRYKYELSLLRGLDPHETYWNGMTG